MRYQPSLLTEAVHLSYRTHFVPCDILKVLRYAHPPAYSKKLISFRVLQYLYMDNCIFCKISAGEIPCYKVYEDETCLAFLDIRPVTVGHMLIIPKSHHEWVQDLPNEILSHCFITAKTLINQIKTKLGADYVQMSVVGKDVPHFHIHLIPRQLSDGLEGWPTQNPDKKDLEAVIEKLNK